MLQIISQVSVNKHVRLEPQVATIPCVGDKEDDEDDDRDKPLGVTYVGVDRFDSVVSDTTHCSGWYENLWTTFLLWDDNMVVVFWSFNFLEHALSFLRDATL